MFGSDFYPPGVEPEDFERYVYEPNIESEHDEALNKLGDEKFGVLISDVQQAQASRDNFEWTAKDKETMGKRVLSMLDDIQYGRGDFSGYDDHSKDFMRKSLYRNVMRAEMQLNGCGDFYEDYLHRPDKQCLVDPGTYLILGNNADGCTSYTFDVTTHYADMYDAEYGTLEGYDDVSLTKLVMDAKAEGCTPESWHSDVTKYREARDMTRRMVNMHMEVSDEAARAQVLYNLNIGFGTMFDGLTDDWLRGSEKLQFRIDDIYKQVSDVMRSGDTQAILNAKSDPVLCAVIASQSHLYDKPVVKQGDRTIKNVPEFMQNEGSDMQYE